MRYSMDLPLHVEVYGPEGYCGHVAALVVHPETQQVRHLVIKEAGWLGGARVVPLAMVGRTQPDLLLLTCSHAAFQQFNLFTKIEWIPRAELGLDDLPEFTPDFMKPLPLEVENVPEGCVVLHENTRVRAQDGNVGVLSEVLVTPGSWEITHIVMQSGHSWEHARITFNADEVKAIEEDVIELALDKDMVVRRPHWTVKY